MWISSFIILIGALTAFYAWFKHKISYFRKFGVPEDPGYFPFGSKPNKDLMTQKLPYIRMTEQIYEKYPDKPFVGVYGFLGTSPNIVINDLELAKHVLIKDFHHFRRIQTIPCFAGSSLGNICPLPSSPHPLRDLQELDACYL